MSTYKIQASTELLDMMFGLPKGYTFVSDHEANNNVTLYIRHDDGKDDLPVPAVVCRVKGEDAVVTPC